MEIPLFDSPEFMSGTRVARIGSSVVCGTAERLRAAEDTLSGSSLGEDFGDVDFGVSPTVVAAPGTPADRFEPFLDRFRSPLRVLSGDGEKIVSNNEPDDGERLKSLMRAIEEVLSGDEPLLIQEIFGAVRNDRYYPGVSGILISENYYPISYMKPEDGIAFVSLGLSFGERASMQAVRFSPLYPELMPDFSLPQDILKNSQRVFYAIDLSGAVPETPAEFDLETALGDGTLAPVGGVYSMENQTIYTGVHRDGIRVVTFSQMLRGGGFPLAKILKTLLDLFRPVFPGSFAIEFTVDPRGSGAKRERHRFSVERVMDRSAVTGKAPIPLDDLDGLARSAVCTSTATLGDGLFDGIQDILAVCPDRLDVSRSHEIAREVGSFNQKLLDAGRPYVLIGSGRWGTSDQWLGIPIRWEDVSGAKIQVEAGLEDFNVESSRGTHFFRELTCNGIGTMHISLQETGDSIDWEWLQNAKTESEGSFVRHLTFDRPLRIRIDGRTSKGVILKP